MKRLLAVSVAAVAYLRARRTLRMVVEELLADAADPWGWR